MPHDIKPFFEWRVARTSIGSTSSVVGHDRAAGEPYAGVFTPRHHEPTSRAMATNTVSEGTIAFGEWRTWYRVTGDSVVGRDAAGGRARRSWLHARLRHPAGRHRERWTSRGPLRPVGMRGVRPTCPSGASTSGTSNCSFRTGQSAGEAGHRWSLPSCSVSPGVGCSVPSTRFDALKD